MKDGEGTFIQGADNGYYRGNYSKDLREGYGVSSDCQHIWLGGCDSYEGYWHLDKKHGHGNLTYDNGNNFVGTFREGQEDGYGVFTATNGTIYSGTWQEKYFLVLHDLWNYKKIKTFSTSKGKTLRNSV